MTLVQSSLRALLSLRCGNMERENRHWIKEDEYKICLFCEEGLDNIKHYVEEYIEVKEWFISVGKNINERIHK